MRVVVTRASADAHTVAVERVPAGFDRVLVVLESRKGDREVVEVTAERGAEGARLSTWRGATAAAGVIVTAAVYLESMAAGEWRVEAAKVAHERRQRHNAP